MLWRIDRVHFWIREEQPEFSYSSYSPGTPCQIWDVNSLNWFSVSLLNFSWKRFLLNAIVLHSACLDILLTLWSDWAISALFFLLIGQSPPCPPFWLAQIPPTEIKPIRREKLAAIRPIRSRSVGSENKVNKESDAIKMWRYVKNYKYFYLILCT